MLEFATLCSGSSGNATFVRGGNTRVIVDIGCTASKLTAHLQEIGVNPHEIDGIFITHEHSDHIKGVSVFARKYGIPVFASPKTCEELPFAGELAPGQLNSFSYDFALGDLEVEFLKLYHDARQPVGMSFYHHGSQFSLVTDTGIFSKTMEQSLSRADGILLEANYSAAMLKNGPYPMFLKQRIAGERGHLSNVDTARALAAIDGRNKQQIVLGHLSEVNNTPETAKREIGAELARLGCPLKDGLQIAPRYEAGPLITLGESVAT